MTRTGVAPVASASQELAARLMDLEARSGQTRQLARLLGRPTVRWQLEVLARGDAPLDAWRRSALARSSVEPLWQIVSDDTEALLRIEREALDEALMRWTTGDGGGRYIDQVLRGPDGVLPRAVRAAVFLDARRACLLEPTSERVQALARATAAFAANLASVVGGLRRVMHELRAHARAPLQLRTYGFGEISRPVGLAREPSPLARSLPPARRVYKRLAPFPDAELVAQYERMYDEYNRRLRDEVGIAVPDYGHRRLRNARGQLVVMATQAALDPGSIGKAILLQRDPASCLALFRLVLGEYRKLVRYNRAQRAAGFAIGIDGQITNWAVRDYRADAPLRADATLYYIDTNTPMMRTGGIDCLPLDFYLQALPRRLRPLLRPVARRVLDRYFDPRTILLDFLANTSIHGRPELVESFLPEGNAFLAEGRMDPPPPPITMADVTRYIASDVATWRLTRSLRVVEEWLDGQHHAGDMWRRIRRIYREPIF